MKRFFASAIQTSADGTEKRYALREVILVRGTGGRLVPAYDGPVLHGEPFPAGDAQAQKDRLDDSLKAVMATTEADDEIFHVSDKDDILTAAKLLAAEIDSFRISEAEDPDCGQRMSMSA